MLWEEINCKAAWRYKKQTKRVPSTESICPVFIQTPDLKFKHRIWKLPQTGIILTDSYLLSFCTRSAVLVLAPLSRFKWCLSLWSGMLPSVPAFPNTTSTGGCGECCSETQRNSCIGNQDTQYLKDGMSDRIMGFYAVVSEVGRYPCFRMVISMQAGLCFPSCRLPERNAVTYFPPKESMQISSKSTEKIC